MDQGIGLNDFPRKWVPDKWRISHDIFLLDIDGKDHVLRELYALYKKNPKDFKSLLSTIRLQLNSEKLLINDKRLKRGKDQKEVLEFKAPRGHSRLFGFIDEEDKKMIICSNTYWKTDGKSKKQDAAFKKAERLMKLYKKSKLDAGGQS